MGKTERTNSQWGADATTVLSVTLVMTMVGLMILVGLLAKHAITEARALAPVSVMLYDDLTPAAIDSLTDAVSHQPGVDHVTFVDRDQALKQWEQDTGENLLEVLGENPLANVLEVSVTTPYTTPDSVAALRQALQQLTGVERVVAEVTQTEAIGQTTRRILTVLGGIGILLLIIALALIMTTVRLRVHAQRHEIRTMSLVGACPGFITRPFALRGAAQGALAGAIAAILLLALTAWAGNDALLIRDIRQALPPVTQLLVALALVTLSAAGCALASWLAARHYVGQ